MGEKPTRGAKKTVAKTGGTSARARGKRAASRIKTTAKVDSVHPDC